MGIKEKGRETERARDAPITLSASRIADATSQGDLHPHTSLQQSEQATETDTVLNLRFFDPSKG